MISCSELSVGTMFSYHHFLPTLGWGKQSTWLAASGSLAPLRAWPAPTLREGADAHRKTPVTAVWALCAGLRAEVETVPLSGVFRRCWVACGAAAVRAIRIQRKNASGGRILGPLGVFDFSTRIKGGGRKRPSPGHKAPRCGAFPAFAEGAPFHHRQRF